MSYIVLARKYRPQKFSEVYAQDHIVQILKNAIEYERIGQAYLFTGSRGVGKTSLARIFAKSLNCERGPSDNPCNVCTNCTEITSGISPDVIEIDGASNTSVDDIRDLQKELMYSTSRSKYKIYIIDEVHMLSKNAFNALLKTLEEPPKNVIFIFATTEPHKIIATIISRCQRFDFKRIPIEAIVANLKDLCSKEKIYVEEEALYIIAKKADGGMRDALSLLDQVISYGNDKISANQVRSVFGIIHADVYHKIMSAITSHNPAIMINMLNEILDKGTDIHEFINSFLDYLRNCLLIKIGLLPNDLNSSQIDIIKEMLVNVNQDELIYMMSYLIDSKNQIKMSHNASIIIEMIFVKLTKLSEMKSLNDILEKLSEGIVSVSNIPQVSNPIQSQIIHEQTKTVQEKFMNIATTNKPAFTNINEEILKQHWEGLMHKVTQEYAITASFLQNCTIKTIHDNHIYFNTNSSIGHKKLISHKHNLEELFSKHFSLRILIDFVLIEIEKPETIKNPTFQDIQKESPNLAKFIELTDSIIQS